MKVNMIKFLKKLFFFIILILFISYFFVGLFNFKEKILSLEKNRNIVNSNIVILTGGSNRIKEGLKIVNDINKLTKTDFKILISGTGKGFTKATLKKIPFDEELEGKEDRFWAQKIVNLNLKYLYDPNFSVYHHYTPSGNTWKGLG